MVPDPQPHFGILAKLLLASSAALLLLLHLYEPPATGLWTQTFFNSLHVPVFGVVAFSLYVATASRTRWSIRKRTAIAIFTLIALSILSEAAQIPGTRDASVQDLISDWLGGAAAFSFAHAFNAGHAASRPTKIALVLIGAGVLLFAMSPLISVSAAYIERSYQKPLVVSMESRFGRYFRRMQHSSLEIIDDASNSHKIGLITLGEGPWPGIIFHDLWPDWRSYSTLIVDFGLDGDQPLDVNIRVHDQSHDLGDQPYDDRFNKTVTLRPGQNTVHIPLEDIQDAPKARRMDLSNISGIVVFCTAKEAGRSFQLVEIRLQ